MKIDFGAYVSEEFQYSQRISIKGGNKTCIRFSEAIISFQIYSSKYIVWRGRMYSFVQDDLIFGQNIFVIIKRLIFAF